MSKLLILLLLSLSLSLYLSCITIYDGDKFMDLPGNNYELQFKEVMNSTLDSKKQNHFFSLEVVMSLI